MYIIKHNTSSVTFENYHAKEYKWREKERENMSDIEEG